MIEKKQVSMKYVIRVNHFLVDMLPIMVPKKTNMKYVVCAKHFLVDIADSGPTKTCILR